MRPERGAEPSGTRDRRSYLRRATAPAIAAALFLSERTVESHLGRAYVKLGVHSKLGLARRAAELGLTRDSL
jgi:DNA-binding CsgD family transcriptional regulator